MKKAGSQSESGFPLKIAILGKKSVGKTALTYRFVKNKYPTEHDTTIEDTYTVPVILDDIHCQFEILDTGGQDDYQTMLDTWINSNDGFILVFSIDNKESFESTKVFYERIIKLKEDKKGKIIVVGNKCDLEESRKVSREEVENFYTSKKITFMETSALKNICVKEIFLAVAFGLLKINFPERYDSEGSEEDGKESCIFF